MGVCGACGETGEPLGDMSGKQKGGLPSEKCAIKRVCVCVL